MKKQILELLKQGWGVDMWIDGEARPGERFVVQVYDRPNERPVTNYYGRTLAEAVKRATEDEER